MQAPIRFFDIAANLSHPSFQGLSDEGE